MRRDELYLRDIVGACDAIAGFLRDVKKDPFVSNDLLQSAVLQKLIMIGEAAARVSAPLEDRHPEIDWAGIVAFRNIAVHAYFSIQWPIVWVSATQEVPTLREQILTILKTEWPGGPPRQDF